jgi:hypothetical protein
VTGGVEGAEAVVEGAGAGFEGSTGPQGAPINGVQGGTDAGEEVSSDEGAEGVKIGKVGSWPAVVQKTWDALGGRLLGELTEEEDVDLLHNW